MAWLVKYLKPKSQIDERLERLERELGVRAFRTGRNYKATPLPTLSDEPGPSAADRERLFKLYDQVCNTWRELVSVRFRLLALLPPVSLALLAAVLSTGGPTGALTPVRRTIIVVAGLIATLGLLIYDLRNNALHNDLISRGRKIEEEIGIDTGLFRGRQQPASWLVQHAHATALVYGAAILGWLCALAAIWLEIKVRVLP